MRSYRDKSAALRPKPPSTTQRLREIVRIAPLDNSQRRAPIVACGASHARPKPGCRVAPTKGARPWKLPRPTPSTTRRSIISGDEIAELSAHLEAAPARLLELIREFDERGGWNTGFKSCAEWLSWRVGLDVGAARERVRVARALPALPRLAQALARGELSYAKVRALTRVATPDTEERLLAVGRAGTAWHVEQVVRAWRRVDRNAEVRETALRHARRAIRVYQDEDGMVVVRGRLAPEAGAALIQALNAAREKLYQERRQTFVGEASENPSFERQQADALTLLGRISPSSRHRPRNAGRTLSSRGACRRGGAGGLGLARPVRPGRRRTRFRGNVTAAGVRREPGGDAAWPGRPRRRGRGPHPNDSASPATRATASRPQLPVPGLFREVRPGPSHSPLGAGWTHHSVEPHSPVPSPPPRRS
jgi:hypothetical protein